MINAFYSKNDNYCDKKRGRTVMYNAHSYAISIERMLNLPYQTSNQIENNPLDFMKGFLDKIYNESKEKARLIDVFDEKYSKYQNAHLHNWDEEDAKQFVKDLRVIFA